jgi:hypothetical protein
LVIGLSAYRHILFDKLVDANREITAAIRPNRQILSSLKISANGVAARLSESDATPLGLEPSASSTQGSSFLATLGWRTQSRWDCPTAGELPSNLRNAFKLFLQIAAAVALACILGAVTFALSSLPYRTAHSSQPELVVSFNHHGAIVEPRKLTKEELAKRLPHMRAQVNVTRTRVPVRLRVQVDGQTVLDQLYQPKGLSHDGPSIAVARLPMAPGPHQVRVELADTADPDKWTRQWNEAVEFHTSRTRVVLFDTKAGFSLH